ncbi:MAG: PBP1b-binding outer membrane lipoprotein LpoB [Lentimonas sp.]|jgi:PBP1b-binding outer membrane lipoprotein LpoB
MNIMKFINLLTLLFAALVFAGCASTDDAAPANDSEGAAAVENQDSDSDSDREGLLMDRYKSGEIPGYRD